MSQLVAISDDELARLLEVVKGADSVELKLTVPEGDQIATGAALGVDPLDAEIRQVYFFDTPDLALNRAGLVARARRKQGKQHDSVVKLRPVVPDELPAKLRESPDMKVEVDAMPGGWICSASLRGKLGSVDVRDALSNDESWDKLFSKRQRAFFAEYAPEGIELGELAVLGPVFILKLNFSPEGYERRLVAEMWLYPDGSRILELSTKCPPSEMFQVAVETRAYLAQRGVNLSAEQQTKTRTTLEFFSRQLAESSATGRD
jgi:hypothetical protein